MGKKLLNILLTAVIAGLVGYLVANWTLNRRIQEQEEVATVVSGTADKKSVPQRRVEVTNVANFSDAAESAVQAVVYVKVTQRNNYQQGGSLLDLIFGFPQTPRD